MSMDRFRLDGRVALVTGASGALGAEFARTLAGAGARVVLAARRVDAMRALADSLSDAHSIVLDVTDPGSVARAVAERHRHAEPERAAGARLAHRGTRGVRTGRQRA